MKMSWIDLLFPKKILLSKEEAEEIERARRDAYVKEAVKLQEELGRADARRQFGKRQF